MNILNITQQGRCWRVVPLVRYVALICLIGLILPLSLSAASLEIEGERAWLKADGEPLVEVLQLFQDRGIEVQIDQLIGSQRISGDWNSVLISQLISKLAHPHSFILEWRQEGGDAGHTYQLSSIKIFPEGKKLVAQSDSLNEKVLDVVEGESGVRYLRSEILVGFRQNSSVSDLERLLSLLDGVVVEVMKPLGLYRIKISQHMSVEDALEIVRSYQEGVAAEPNLAFPLIASTVEPQVNKDNVLDFNRLSDSSVIAVLDSGLDPSYADHSFILDTYNAIDPSSEINDPNGHGTLTSLIAAGAITPLGGQEAVGRVPVVSIKAFDKNGMTSSGTVIRALEYAINSGASIVSMSWGAEVDSSFMKSAMNMASRSGIKLYAAAGNSPTGTPVYPAGYDSVIAVGGLNPDGSRWEDSNYGDFVEYYEPALANFEDKSFAGTSIAAPYAAFKDAQSVTE
ncbi:S8 family peptidase [Desulforhopalus sp. 52FAK]